MSADRVRVLDAVVRVSRRNGRSGDSFMSPDEQRSAIEARAERDNVRIAQWFDETDSVSGGTVEREGLQAAIRRAQQGLTDGIIVAKVDRFSRVVQGGLGAITQLEDAGKELWSAREGVIVGDEKATATDKLVRTFWLALAQWQRDTLTEGWEAVRHRHIGNGVANHAKYGYRKDLQTRRLVPDLAESEWVVPIFERRAARESWAAIAEWLTDQGAPTRDGAERWSYTSVRGIVESRVYLGEICSGDIVNPSAHEPLVPLDLWERANAVETNPGPRSEKGSYLLTGLIRCASCGVRMSGMISRQKDGGGNPATYAYYRCRSNHGSWGKCPQPARILAAELDELVEDVFRSRFLTGRAVPAEATGDLDAALEAQRAAEADLEHFLTAPSTDELRRTMGPEWFDTGMRARMDRVNEARDAVAEVRNAALGTAFPTDLADLWDSLDVNEKRGFLADGFALVAVAPGRGQGYKRLPAADRCRIWTRNDSGIPTDLPARGGSGLRAIPLDVPARTGMTAGE